MHSTRQQLTAFAKYCLDKALPLCLAALYFPLEGAENNDGTLGLVSEGTINMVLEVNHAVTAGFLRTNLDDPEADFQALESYRLIQSLQLNSATTIPLCVFSSDGGSYSIGSFEIPGMENRLQSEYGSVIPFDVMIGDSDRPESRYRAVTGDCGEEDAIPVTIRTSSPLNGDEVGRMKGQFNLLIKME